MMDDSTTKTRRREAYKNVGRAATAARSRRAQQRQRASASRQQKRELQLNLKRLSPANEVHIDGLLKADLSEDETTALVDKHLKSVESSESAHALEQLLAILQISDIAIAHFLKNDGALAFLLTLLMNQELCSKASQCLILLSTSPIVGDEILMESVDVLCTLCESADTDESLRAKALWVLGNIAARNNGLRDAVMANSREGQLFLDFVADASEPEVALRAWYALSHLLRGQDANIPSFIDRGILNLAQASIESGDAAMCGQVCWSLTYITAKLPEHTSEALNAATQSKLAQLFFTTYQLPLVYFMEGLSDDADAVISQQQQQQHDGFAALGDAPEDVVVSVLRCIGNAAANGAFSLDDALFFMYLHAMLDHPSRLIATEAAWAFGNITAIESCAHILLELNVFPTLCQMLYAASELQIEAAHSILNLVHAHPAALERSVEEDIPQGMCQLLRYGDREMTICALTYIKAVCEKIPHACTDILPEQALEQVESLQYDDNEMIGDIAKHITDTFLDFDFESSSEAHDHRYTAMHTDPLAGDYPQSRLDATANSNNGDML